MKFNIFVSRPDKYGVEEVPRHLRVETYYLREIQHVKDHLIGMLGLCLPDLHAERMQKAEDWEKVSRSLDGQFQILFGSLDLIRAEVGDEMHRRLVEMAGEVRELLDAKDYPAAAFKIQDMDDLGWSKRSQARRGRSGV